MARSREPAEPVGYGSYAGFADGRSFSRNLHGQQKGRPYGRPSIVGLMRAYFDDTAAGAAALIVAFIGTVMTGLILSFV